MNQRKRKFSDLPTAEILAIVEKRDRSQWTDEELAAAAELLEDRRAGIAFAPRRRDREPGFSEVSPSVSPSITLRVCAFLYFVFSTVGAVLVMAHQERMEVFMIYFVLFAFFQGLTVCAFLLVVANVAEKVNRISSRWL